MSLDKDFHLYLLIGQSNMSGRGPVKPQDRVTHPRVLALNKTGEWEPAADPLHFDRPNVGVGPGLTFGKVVADFDASIHVGLIPSAAGGSPISMWKSGAYFAHTGSYPYDDAVARTRIAMKDGLLKGILWHQGESDSNKNNAHLYEKQLITLVNSLRRDIGAPNVLFLVATLGEFFVEQNSYAGVVNLALKRLPQLVKDTVCVDANGLASMGDSIHFCSQALRELGRRYAEAMIQKQYS